MGLIIGLIGIIISGVYYVIAYNRFEFKVKQEQIVSQALKKKILQKTRISGVILSFSSTLIFLPTPHWGLYLFALILWTILVVWGVTGGTKSGIKRLEMKYGKE